MTTDTQTEKSILFALRPVTENIRSTSTVAITYPATTSCTAGGSYPTGYANCLGITIASAGVNVAQRTLGISLKDRLAVVLDFGDGAHPLAVRQRQGEVSTGRQQGGDDLNDDGDSWEIITPPSAYETVLDAVKKSGAEVLHSVVGMIPKNYVKLEGAAANQMIRLLETIEEPQLCR